MIFSHSQNFLHSKELVKNLIIEAKLSKEHPVLDIGAGNGIISEILLTEGFEVYAFEIDKKYVDILKKKFGNNPKFKLIEGDFLEFKFWNKEGPYQIFSNIPFNQTTKILKKILIDENVFSQIYIVMQKQAADRIRGIKEGLLISLLTLNNFKIQEKYQFRYSDFRPVARVKSVLINFQKRERPLVDKKDEVLFRDFLSFIIMQQRPSILERVEKLLPASRAVKFLNLSEINLHQNLYDIDKIKFFEMFEIFKNEFKDIHKKVEKSYANYLKINESNVKVYRTRQSPQNEIPRTYNQRSNRNSQKRR